AGGRRTAGAPAGAAPSSASRGGVGGGRSPPTSPAVRPRRPPPPGPPTGPSGLVWDLPDTYVLRNEDRVVLGATRRGLAELLGRRGRERPGR
ncbi:potassium transporter TrkA, partial [Streptomyces prasinus]